MTTVSSFLDPTPLADGSHLIVEVTIKKVIHSYQEIIFQKWITEAHFSDTIQRKVKIKTHYNG